MSLFHLVLLEEMGATMDVFNGWRADVRRAISITAAPRTKPQTTRRLTDALEPYQPVRSSS